MGVLDTGVSLRTTGELSLRVPHSSPRAPSDTARVGGNEGALQLYPTRDSILAKRNGVQLSELELDYQVYLVATEFLSDSLLG